MKRYGAIGEQIVLGVIIAVFLLLSLFVLSNLEFYPFFSNKPFILELFKTNFDLPLGVILLSSCLNIFLLYLLIKKLFSQTSALITIGVYAISPWSIYLGIFNSLYVLATFFLLLLSLGIILSREKIGLLMIIVGAWSLLSLSFLFLFPLLIFLVLNLKFHLLKKKLAKYLFFSVLIFQLFLLTLGIRDKAHFKQVILQQVTIFEDVGLLNTINTFQGETQKTNSGLLGRFIENKYTYLPLKVIFNISNQWTPLTFFTPKYKILSFSNQPPILLGFLIPLVWGLKYLKEKKRLLVVSGLFFLLTLPSVLATNSPDLNRLFIAAPPIFLIIGLGVEKMFQSHKKLLFLSLIFVTWQMLIILADIYLREPMRLLPVVLRIYGEN